ncbi:MAG: alkaline phosphatase family protein, partial [Actinomycetota bacterium]|nr:alkaline phosphatase family protein [Actinomycetota bacterium]
VQSESAEPAGEASPFARRIACGLPPEWLQRIRNGYDPERSADIQILPKVPNFVGSGLPHVGPWSFTSEVPLLWYGPGYIKPVGPVQEPVTAADIMATYDHLLDSSFEPVDGEPMLDGLVPAAERPEPPRLLVMMVWDGAGRNVLAEWPDEWPNLARLRSQGAWYEHATVGSSPTSSAQIHATFGTAAFPEHHGVVGHTIRIDGELVSPWKDGPLELELETFGDHYDREHGNEPIVGTAGTVPIQLGMMSRGAYADGGDRDIAVLRVPGNALTLGAEGETWNIPEGFDEWYEYPGYANELPPLPSYFDDVDLDARDGRRDGMWHGHPFEDSEELLDGFHTPARVPYQTRLIEEVITREGFGADETTDLFFINYKLIDTLGHLYGIQDETMRDAVETQDQDLGRFVEFLDRQVGKGRWAMVVTADHGSLESAATTGAFQVSAEKLHSSIQDEFDEDDDDVTVIDQVKQTEIFMNVEELDQQGHTLDDVSRFIMNLRQSRLQIPGLAVPDPNAEVFQAAFPAEALLDLPCLQA